MAGPEWHRQLLRYWYRDERRAQLVGHRKYEWPVYIMERPLRGLYPSHLEQYHNHHHRV